MRQIVFLEIYRKCICAKYLWCPPCVRAKLWWVLLIRCRHASGTVFSMSGNDVINSPQRNENQNANIVYLNKETPIRVHSLFLYLWLSTFVVCWKATFMTDLERTRVPLKNILQESFISSQISLIWHYIDYIIDTTFKNKPIMVDVGCMIMLFDSCPKCW